MHAVLTPVGNDLYAVPVEWVRQVLVAPPLTPLVTAPTSLLGLFNLRGEIVPLLDTAVLLGVGTLDTAAFVVVLDTPHGPAGLASTGVPERAVLDAPAASSELAGTGGSYLVDGRVVVLLDLDALLAPDRLGTPEFRSAVPAGVD